MNEKVWGLLSVYFQKHKAQKLGHFIADEDYIPLGPDMFAPAIVFLVILVAAQKILKMSLHHQVLHCQY